MSVLVDAGLGAFLYRKLGVSGPLKLLLSSNMELRRLLLSHPRRLRRLWWCKHGRRRATEWDKPGLPVTVIRNYYYCGKGNAARLLAMTVMD